MDPLARLFLRWRTRGDLDALGTVFDRAAPRLLGLALQICSNPADAEDLLQQAFLGAIRSAAAFDGTRPLLPWLAGLLTNAARNLRRRELHRKAVELPDLADPAPAPPSAAARGEQVALLRSHIEALPLEQRQVLLLQLQHGLQPAEIAEVLGIAPGTVRMRIHRGLRALRRLLPAGLAGGMLATLSARGLAAVRVEVLREATQWTPVAAPGVLVAAGGVLTMKQVLWFAAAVLVLLIVGGIVPSLWPGPAPRPPAETPTIAADLSTAPAGEFREPPLATPGRSPTAAPPPRHASLTVRVVALLQQEVAPGLFESAWDGSGGEPLADMPVYAHPKGESVSPLDVLAGRTDDAGEVCFHLPTSGTWNIAAHTLSAQARSEVAVQAGASTEVTLPVTMANAVAGMVVDRDDVPVADAQVWVGQPVLGDVNPSGVVARCAGRTDVHGRFRVFTGSHDRLSARKPGHAESFSCEPPPGDARIRLVLEPDPGTVAGTVVDRTGRPLGDVTVCLVYQHASEGRDDLGRAADGSRRGKPVPLLTRTDDGGRFTLDGLLPGRYRLWTEAPRYFLRRIHLEVERLTRHEVRLQLDPLQVLHGRAVHPDGSPAAGLEIRILEPDGRVTEGGGTWSAPDGTFLLSVPERPFRLQARRNGQVVAEQPVAQPLPDPPAVELIADERLDLAGRLVADGVESFAGWRIVVSTDRGQREAATGADGGFAFWQLGPGPFRVRALPCDLDAPSVELRSVPGGTTGLRLEIPADHLPTGSIVGSVVDHHGNSLPAWIELSHPRLGQVPSDWPIAGDGRFEFAHLFTGHYRLDLGADGCASLRIPCQVQAGQRLDLGRIALAPAASLRVRTLGSDGGTWPGPPVAARLRSENGADVAPWPRGRIEGDAFVLTGLGPGRYQVVSPDPELLAEPLTVELAAGQTLAVDWRVAVGRRCCLVFPGVDDGATLDVVVADATGREVLVRRLEAEPAVAAGAEPTVGRLAGRSRSERTLEHVFAAGRYQVSAQTGTGRRHRATFAVELQRSGPARVAVPRER